MWQKNTREAVMQLIEENIKNSNFYKKPSYNLYGGIFVFFLTRKRIYIIFGCLVLIIAIGHFCISKEVNVKETVALPVNNKVIILDAGHGGEDRWRCS